MQCHLLSQPDASRLMLFDDAIGTDRSDWFVRELKTLIDDALRCG